MSVGDGGVAAAAAGVGIGEGDMAWVNGGLTGGVIGGSPGKRAINAR